MGMCLNDSGTFLYQKDLQGDIVALITPNGQIVLEYIYDSYGNININTPDNSVGSAILAMFILALNPLSYRGYLYAPGIGISYYLGSRFYSPEICRFVNADIHQDTNTNAVGTNMFAYCNNNPVNCINPNGEMAIVSKMLSVAIIFLATYLIYTYVSTSVSALFHQLQTSTVRTALQQNTALQGYATNAFTNFVKELRYAVIQRVELAIVEAYLKVNELSVKSPHKHHIVVKDAPAAELGRSVLHASKIPINSKYNLVELDANFHIVLHTSFYHTVVGLYLLDVWKETASTKSVQHALALIAISLKSFELMI